MVSGLPVHNARPYKGRQGGLGGLCKALGFLVLAFGCVASLVVLRNTQAENGVLKSQLKAQGGLSSRAEAAC